MRIGSQDVANTARSYGPRQQVAGPQVGPRVDTSGLSALAGAVAGMGQLGSDYLRVRTQEEEERQNYDSLLKYQQFEGDVRRGVSDAQTGLPADGAGYSQRADEIYRKRFEQFNSEIPAWLRERYAPRAEGLRQQLLITADGYTRDATRGHSISTIENAVQDARLEVYKNPGARGAQEARIGEMIEAAPGLLADERTQRARQALETLNGASFGGTIRQGREAMFAVPFSRDVSSRLVPAIIKQESGGNPNALSNKNAAGLMQVIPSTGIQIAEDIGDQNFPLTGGRDAQIEYLKKPGVSIVYGTFYFNQLLQRYGGDVELALVGYNAGPGVADKYQAAGRNRSVLPEETKNYVDSIVADLGGVTPEMAFDPQFGLNLDQALAGTNQIEQIRSQAFRDAEQNVAAMTQAAAQQHDAALNQLYMRAEAGEDFRPMYMDAVAQGQIQYNRTELAGGMEISNRVLETQRKITGAFQKAMTGEPLSNEEANYLFPPAVREGIVQGDQPSIQASVDAAARIGFIPPALAQTMTQMLWSQDMGQVGIAAEMYATMQRTNPAIVQNLPDEFVARANSFNAQRAARLPSDQLQGIMNVTGTVEGRKTLKTLQDADPDYKENLALAPADMANWFDSWLPFTGDTAPPSDPGSAALLQQQYQSLYQTYYANTLDAKQAKEMTLQQLRKTWGPTETGGQQRLGWMPPEMVLGNFTWDLDGDGELEHVSLPPDQARASFDRQVAQKFGLTRYMSLAVPETETAVQQGKPIPYAIIPLDEDGEVAWDLSKPEQLRLLSGEMFSYNYGDVIKDQLGLQRRQQELQSAVDAFEQSGDPAAAAEMYKLQQELQEVTDQIGAQ